MRVLLDFGWDTLARQKPILSAGPLHLVVGLPSRLLPLPVPTPFIFHPFRMKGEGKAVKNTDFAGAPG